MLHYADMRPAPFMDKMVSIYRSLDATFSTYMSKLVSSGTHYKTFFFSKMKLESYNSKEKEDNKCEKNHYCHIVH